MTAIPSYFNDFLRDIRMTENQVNDLIKGHSTLRKRLNEYKDLSDILVSTFLQGSYRRATATRPKNGKRSDVDVIVVTNLNKDEYTPEQALNLFEPFLEEYYKGKYRFQGRSIGIELSYVELDLVVTSAPSEIQKGLLTAESVTKDYSLENLNDWLSSKTWVLPDELTSPFQFLEKAASDAEWKTEPLYIPDRDAEKWSPTDPLAQIKWTWEKNKACNQYFVNVVKALKWWRKFDDPASKHPKSYPLEHLIGQCCPDSIQSVGEGVTLTLEKIVSDYQTKPVLPDHGVPEHDVFKRLTDEEYDAFYERVEDAAEIAREAFDAETVASSAEAWGRLFGSKFPNPPKNTNQNNGFSVRKEKTEIGGSRFA